MQLMETSLRPWYFGGTILRCFWRCFHFFLRPVSLLITHGVAVEIIVLDISIAYTSFTMAFHDCSQHDEDAFDSLDLGRVSASLLGLDPQLSDKLV
jgi:hypothetical protein